MGRSELSVLVSVFISPLGICFGLFFMAMVVYRFRPVLALGTFLFSLALLWVSATPFVANTLAQLTERPYPPSPISDVPTADAIVLLGGGVRSPAGAYGFAELNEAGDRVIHAYRLFSLNKASTIISTGGRVFKAPGSLSEAEYMRDILVQLGVPVDNILIEPASRNTRENATATLALLRQPDVQATTGLSEDSTYLLVTSASHMQRSVNSFAKVGINVIPAPTDYRAKQTMAIPFRFLPSARALSLSSSMIREQLALLAYRGYTSFNPQTGTQE